VHVSGVTRAQASEWGDSVPQTPVNGGGGGLKWGGVDKVGVSADEGSAAAVPIKATSASKAEPGPTAMATVGAGGKDRGTSSSTHAATAAAAAAPMKPSISTKPADSGEEQDLPAEFVFVCTEGRKPAEKIRIDAETGKFQVNIHQPIFFGAHQIAWFNGGIHDLVSMLCPGITEISVFGVGSDGGDNGQIWARQDCAVHVGGCRRCSRDSGVGQAI